MLKNAPISPRPTFQYVLIRLPESLRGVHVGIRLVPQSESLGGVVLGFEDGAEDARDAVDFDDGRARFEFLDLGLGS